MSNYAERSTFGQQGDLVLLSGIGAMEGERLEGVIDSVQGDQILVSLPSYLRIYFWDYGSDDPETGNQVSGGASGYRLRKSLRSP